MEIYRITFTKADLASLPVADRSLLLLLGHASNEINTFSKLILMVVRKDQAPSPIADRVEAGQALILLRVLVGKAHEAWELFKKRVQADRSMVAHSAQLDATGTAALARLNQHFGSGSALTSIRNKVAFHYKDDDDLADKSFQSVAPTEALEFYLTNPVGNSFYYASEVIMSLATLDFCKSSPTDSEAQAFSNLCRIVIDVSRDLTELFGQLMGIIVTTRLPNLTATTEQHPDGPKLSTLALPYFVDYNNP